jgi:dephospho-CoA kinase
MLRLGLTGGIGSGKSTVAGMLVAWGAALVDADAIDHHQLASGLAPGLQARKKLLDAIRLV